MKPKTLQLNPFWIPDLQNHENKKVRYIKPLSIGMVCYIDTKGNPK